MKFIQAPLLFALAMITGNGIAANPSTRPAVGLRDKTPACHALKGGRIVVAPGQVLEKGTIVVRKGMIIAVGTDVKLPEDARIWDLDGQTIYAGLIDAYSESSAKAPNSKTSSNEGAHYWNSQVQPERRVAAHYTVDEQLNKQLRSQGITARLVAPEGGIIKGVSALISTGDDHADRVILNDTVALHVRLTINHSDDDRGYPNSPMGAVALARQAMIDADWYTRVWQAYRGSRNLPRPEQNEALTALQPYLVNGGLVIVDTSDEQFHLRADRFAREFGLNLVVRGSGREYRRINAICESGRAIIVPVDFPKAPNVATAESAARVTLRDMMHWDIAPENPARLVEAGATIALTSHGLKSTDKFLDAVRRAVHRGLSSEEALRALTVTPAALLGADDRLGTIEAGKAANFVVTEGELFEKKTKIRATWIDGRRYEVASQPLVDLRGTWQLDLKGGTGKRPKGLKQLEITIRGEPNKLSGTVGLPAEETEERADDTTIDTTDEAAANDKEAKNNEAGGQTIESDKVKKTIKLQDIQLSDTRLDFRFDDKKDSDADKATEDRAVGGELGIDGVVRVSATAIKAAAGEWTWEGQIHWPLGGYSELHAEKVADADDKQANNNDADQKNSVVVVVGSKSEQIEDDAKQEKEDDLPASFTVNYPLGVYGRKNAPDQPELVAFTGATVWTCDAQGVLDNATVLVGAGKIIAVGSNVEVPPAAKVIHVQGLHITPGLIDCHSHMATDGGINESAQAVTAEVRIGDFIDSSDITIYRQLAGGLTTANVLHGSANPIGGQNQVIKLRWGALPEAMKFDKAPGGVKFALGENVKQSNWGSKYTTRYPQTRMGVEQLVRDEFNAAREYQAAQDAWARHHKGLPPRRDLELDAVAEILAGERWIHCHSYRQDEILTLLRTLEEFDVQIGTLQHILEGYKVADAMARHGAMASSFADWWAYKFEVYDAIPYNGAIMNHAGINVSYNSDDSELGRHLNQEAAKAVKYGGVPPAEALKFVTLNPAMQLRIDSYVGSITPDKHADLVVWNGPPLSNFSRVEQTWIDGRNYFDRGDEAKHRATTHNMRATLVQKILRSGQTMAKPGEENPDEQELWPREDIFCHGHTLTHDH
jgi:N-acetylglucosamine-6-phosphate deacetylase